MQYLGLLQDKMAVLTPAILLGPVLFVIFAHLLMVLSVDERIDSSKEKEMTANKVNKRERERVEKRGNSDIGD
jgi:hypothetical protein